MLERACFDTACSGLGRVIRTLLTLAALLSIAGSSALFGVPACPSALWLTQPDGTPFQARLRGDERSHWEENAEGFSIARDPVTRRWCFAVRDAGGRLVPSAEVVGVGRPEALGVSRHLMPVLSSAASASVSSASGSASRVASAPSAPSRQGAAPVSQEIVSTRGPLRGLVILANFSDTTTQYTQAEFDALFNQLGYNRDGCAGSVREYYDEVSYGQLDFQNTVTAWVTLPNTHDYYGSDAPEKDANGSMIVFDAIHELFLQGFDFSPYDSDGDGELDHLCVIHQGRGQEVVGNDPNHLWSKAWTWDGPVGQDGVLWRKAHTEPEVYGADAGPAAIQRPGVIVHEAGHFLGLPDLYDTDYSSKGVGDWDVMAAGSWNNEGKTPAHFSSWSKWKLGWLTPTELLSNGVRSLPNLAASASAYLIRERYDSRESLLVENRAAVGFDAALPSFGMLIWHVDEAKPNNDDEESHYRVALVQADGLKNLEANSNEGDPGDCYPGSSDNRELSPTSNPSSDSYFMGRTGVRLHTIGNASETMTFTAAIPATVKVRSVSAPPVISQGQSGIPVDAVVENVGGNAADVSSSGLVFSGLPSDYTVTCASCPSVVAAGATATFTFAVDAAPGAAVGPVTLAGEVRAADATAAVSTTSLASHAYRTALSDKAEGGLVNLTATGTWGTTAPRSVSGSSFHDSPSGLYANSTDTSLTSVAIALGGADVCQLSYWECYDLESGWDYGYTEISLDGGAWVPVSSVSGFQALFERKVLTIPGVSGKSQLRVRFRVYADIIYARDGWYLDDVEVSLNACDKWTVLTPARLAVNTLVAAPTYVSRGQTVSPVTMSVTNTGQSTAIISAAGLTFGGTAAGYEVTQLAGPATLSGGGVGTFSFAVTATVGAATGLQTIDGHVTAVDALGGGDASDSGATSTDSWTVQTPAQLAVNRIVTTATFVSHGQTVSPVSMSVTNTGQAGATIAASRLAFGGTTSGYTVTKLTGPASLAGGAVANFTYSVAVTAGAATGLQAITGLLTATDSNSGAPAGAVGATAADFWTVQTPALISIGRIDALPAFVSHGQVVSPVTMGVTNTGEAAAMVSGASLTFGGTSSGYAVTQVSGPSTLAGGAAGSFSFDVTVTAAAAAGSKVIDGAVTATDGNSGAAAGASGAGSTDAWTVQLPAVLVLQSVTTAPGKVSQGQTGVGVRAVVANTGVAQGVVDDITLTFTGTSPRAGDYGVTPPGLPRAVAGGATATFDFSVDVSPAAACETIALNGTLAGRDGNSNAVLTDSSADAGDSWLVQSPARIVLGRVDAAPSFVCHGQHVSPVTMTVTNTGQATAIIGPAALTFGGSADGYQVAVLSGPLTLAGGQAGAFAFGVTVTAGAATGAQPIDGLAAATDANSGADAGDAGVATPDSWTVLTPAKLEVNAVSAGPVFVSRGQFVSPVTMSVTNTGQSTAVITGAGLTFGGGTAGYAVTQVSGPATLSGGAVGLFAFDVTVTDSASTGLQLLDGGVTATDSILGSAAGDSGAAAPDGWTVQTPARLEIGEVATGPTVVSRGQFVSPVSMSLTNTGQATAVISAAGLTFGGTASGYTVTQTAGPSRLTGGSGGAFSFDVTVTAGAATGLKSIDGFVTATDANSGAGAGDAAAAATDTWTVQTPAVLEILRVSTAPLRVSRGQANIPVQVELSNPGQATANLTGAGLTFAGAVDRTGDYAVAAGANPTSVAGGVTATFDFTVGVGALASCENIAIQAAFDGLDANSGASLSDRTANQADGWLVQTPAALTIRSVTAAPLLISRGQTVSGVTMVIENSGQATALVDPATASP